MKIHCISDLHGNTPTIPTCNLLIMAGDYWGYGYAFGTEEQQGKWIKNHLKKMIDNLVDNHIVNHIVMIAGNHDGIFQTKTELVPEMKCHYLCNNSITIDVGGDNVEIYGTPHTPWFLDWAFNMPKEDKETEELLRKTLRKIPNSTDIIVSHGPPFGICDRTERGENVGSKALRGVIDRVNPKLVVCGHIHAARNVVKYNDTLVVNASIVREGHKKHNDGITLEGDNLSNLEVVGF